MPRGFRRGDARGGAPCIRKLKNLPLPAGKGVGGIGAKAKLKAGQAGDIGGKPPCGHHSGRVGRRQTKQVPHGRLYGRDSRCRAGSAAEVPAGLGL